MKRAFAVLSGVLLGTVEAGGTTTEAVEVAQAFLVHFTLPPCAWRGVVRRALAVLSSVLLGFAALSGVLLGWPLCRLDGVSVRGV